MADFNLYPTFLSIDKDKPDTLIWPPIFEAPHDTEQMIAIPEVMLAAILQSLGGKIVLDGHDLVYAKDNHRTILIEKTLDPFMWIISLEKK